MTTTTSDLLSLRGQDIVCIGFADWETELWTNQHHLMSRLAADNRILFVESLGLRRPTLSGRDLARIWRRLRRGLAPPRVTDGLHVISPLIMPAHDSRLVRGLNARLLPTTVAHAARRLGMKRPILWSYVPQAEMLIDALQPALVVYHCVDDIAAQPGVDAKSFRAAEQRFGANADLVLTSSPPLDKRLRRLSKNVVYAPNVADTSLFAAALQPGPLDASMEALARPRIVFTGAIVQTKLDMSLIVRLARLRPRWSIALVGPVGLGDPSTDVSALVAESNIHLLGHRNHRDLPAVLRASDAAMIPYAINALTESIFPMKVYEYLSAGLPVVATPLPSLIGMTEVATAPDPEGMVYLLTQALRDDGPQERAKRSHAAEGHSWEQRLQEIAVAVNEAMEIRMGTTS